MHTSTALASDEQQLPLERPAVPSWEGAVPAALPWTGRNWPATTSDEAVFVARLTEVAPPRQGPPRRSDATAVLNALRCGIGVDELLRRAPGLQAGRLLAAYQVLERERRASELAWQAIAADPTLDTFYEHAAAAARLLPAVLGRLRAVMHLHPRSLALAVQEQHDLIERARREVHRIERALDRCVPPSDRGVELGRTLYDPWRGGLTGSPEHLPDRVGTLVPTRVAALLGERVDVSGPPRPPEALP